MHKWLLAMRVLAATIALVALCAPAGALLIAVDSGSSLVFRTVDVPGVVRTGSYSCFLWLQPEAAHDERRRVYSIPGGVKITLEPGAGVRAVRLPTGVEATASARLEPGQWALIAVSWDNAAGRLDVWAGSEGKDLSHGGWQATPTPPSMGGEVPFDPAPDEPWALGAAGGEPGVPGAYGLIVVRGHAIGDSDAREVWASRRLFAPYDLDNRASGGRMTGWHGGVHMVGHAITTGPTDGGVGGDPSEHGAIVGWAMTERNVHILNAPAEPQWPEWRGFMTVRPVESVTGIRYGSRHEPEHGGFFVRDVPASALPDWPTPSMQRMARQLVDGPEKPLRVIASANSRGVRSSAIFGPQNFIHGFAELNLAQVSGAVFRPVSLRGSRRWLGFDCALADPPTWLDVDYVDVPNPTRADFSRFFTVAGATSRGGGSGVIIRPGGFHRLRCSPVAGSLIQAEAPLVSEALVLRFPGSSDLLWRPDRGASQSAEGRRIGPAQQVELDTTRLTHVCAAGEGMLDDYTLALSGDFTALIEPGDACYVAAGPGAESISVVSELAFVGGETLITVEHPFGERPDVSSTLHFGAWGYHTVRHEWDGLAPGDPDVWRGLELACDSVAPGPGVVALAVSAYREDVPGFIFGAAGWGGHGYDSQLDENFSAAPERWMAASKADVWIQSFAQQQSHWRAMSRYADVIERALPEAEIVWAGDGEHGHRTFEEWHTYILEQGPRRGYAAVTALVDPEVGSFIEQLADGMRADMAHWAGHGNLALAAAWTRQLDEATFCVHVDLDGDGAFTFFDMLAFITLFTAGDLRADFDGDGELTIFDYIAFQTGLYACDS